MPLRTTGRYERAATAGEEVTAFVPLPLPPSAPGLAIEGKLEQRFRQADQALTRLDLAGEMAPSIDWFIYGFVRKEAVGSSQIEGTQATLINLLTYEADAAAPNADVEEICNYLDALNFAREQVPDKRGFPISTRLLNHAHERLMRGVRRSDKQPGQIRPKLVRVGLLHVQFETVHPYLDGNGRIGRLLISLLLEHWQLLSKPLLYLSLFFKRHRDEYYRRLNAVRTEGDWEGWTNFFLDGVATIADEAVGSARELSALVAADRARILRGRKPSVAALRLFEALPRHPMVTVASAVKLIEASKPTATRAIETLVDAGVLVETTGKKRDRSFAYSAYLDRLRAGTELADSL